MPIAQQQLNSIHFHSLKGLIDLKINFRPNGLTGIFGVNGSGKSTIIHAIACIYKGISQNYIMSQFFTPTTHGKWNGSNFTVEYSYSNPPTQKNIISTSRIYRKAAQRWVPEYSKRLEREIRFIGIETCVPDIELETRSSLINFQIEDKSDILSLKILKSMSSILNKQYDRHSENTFGKKTYIGVESEGVIYSALSMGAGEQRLFKILKAVYGSPKYALIIIDEIDLLLHTSALRNLLNELIIHAKAHNQQIIFTSHRQEILSLDEIDYKHIHKTPTKTLCFENTTPDCISRLTGNQIRLINIFVEDDLSEAIVSQIAGSLSIRSNVSISRFGAAANSFTVAAGTLLSGNSLEHTLIVLDGDVYRTSEEKEKQIKYILAGDDPKMLEFRRIALNSIHQYTLPENYSPEKFLHQMLILSNMEDEIIKIAKTIIAVNNNHEFINQIIHKLGVSKEIGLFKIVNTLSVMQKWTNYIENIKKAMEDLKTKNNL
jgi:ABC-type dipeptide/oligopeptide/nickel transport system ATPase subunit